MKVNSIKCFQTKGKFTSTLESLKVLQHIFIFKNIASIIHLLTFPFEAESAACFYSNIEFKSSHRIGHGGPVARTNCTARS
jgi:hypothetical protein